MHSKPADGIMGTVQKIFRAIDVGDGSDGRWAAHLRTLFPQAEGWLTGDGRTADRAVTVYLGPDIELTEAPDACAANHQHLPVPEEVERTTRTQQRLAAIRALGGDVSAMLRPPLYEARFDDGYGTLYTADYQPKQGRVSYHWPGEAREQSFDRYTTGSRSITLVDRRLMTG